MRRFHPFWGKNPPQMSSFFLVCFWCKGLRFHMESTSYPGWFNLKYLSSFLWFNFPCRYKCIIYLYHWIWIVSIMNPFDLFRQWIPFIARPNVIETLRALNKLSVNLETQSNPIINRLMFTVYLYVKSVSSPEPWIRFYI